MVAVDSKVCLIVIDGWGIAPASDSNAVTLASTPVMSGMAKQEDPSYLSTEVSAHGLSVGLPDGVMGNSEVGHLTIGAGRVNFQDLERINFAMADGSFRSNPELQATFSHAKSGNGRLHLLGLVSDGGVHSHIDHIKQFLLAARDAQVPECYVHFFADGRDTAPRSARLYLRQLLDFMTEINYGKVASVCGRYYAMDRDNRWERVELAYNGLVAPISSPEAATVVADYDSLFAAIEANYANDITDEFTTPIVVAHGTDLATIAKLSAREADLALNGTIRDGDTMILFDFRADRMREIANVLGMKHYPFERINDDGESTTIKLNNTYLTTMTQYDSKYTMPVLFKPNNMRDGLAEWISKLGLTQFHTAETEKYAHVTFFFNGGIEQAFKGEVRDMVQSPKVPTYDLQPEMNAVGVAHSVVSALTRDEFAFVMCNFAPPDMVGHTGVLPAAVKAIAATDAAIGEIAEACRKYGYTLVITADHGNAEQMVNPVTGAPHTAHTANPVPMYIQLSQELTERKRKDETEGKKWTLENGGGVADIAPTVLEIMGLSKPEVMTGKSLLHK